RTVFVILVCCPIERTFSAKPYTCTFGDFRDAYWPRRGRSRRRHVGGVQELRARGPSRETRFRRRHRQATCRAHSASAARFCATLATPLSYPHGSSSRRERS